MPAGGHAIWTVIPAAGVGLRMQANCPKQYLPLAGATVIAHTLYRFIRRPDIAGIVVALGATDGYWSGARPTSDKPLEVVEGGATRSASVRRALEFLTKRLPDSSWVMVHDAVRPCLHADDISRLIAELASDPVGGILALPVSDTLKSAEATQRIHATVDRRDLWRALTPQMFRLGPLCRALGDRQTGPTEITDEAGAMELAGYAPRLIEGRPDNIKITRPEDLALAEVILEAQQRSAVG